MRSVFRVLLAVGAPAVPVWAQASLVGVGIPVGANSSSANSVSADGSMIVGTAFYPSSNDPTAYRWTRSGGMFLQASSGNTEGLRISADGSTLVGGYYSFWPPGVQTAGYKWDSGGLHLAPHWFDQTANGVSGDGSIVVGHVSSSISPPYQAYTWSGNTLTTLPNPLGGSADARTISQDGTVVVGSAASLAAVWRNGAFTSLGALPGFTSSTAYGISGDNTVVVGTLGLTNTHAFRWTQGSGLVDLPLLAGTTTASAGSVSADGHTIIGRCDTTPCVWIDSAPPISLLQYLQGYGATGLSGWQLKSVSGVSADGSTFVGSGIDPLGRSEGYVATIPGPSAAAPLLLFSLAHARRRRK